MSEHTIDQHDIELPELPKDEDELRLDEIAEVVHDFLSPKESESLEAQSATYSQEEQVIDRRIESQERVQALETALGTSTPRPTPSGLQQARTVRNSAAQRRLTPATSYTADYVQRAQAASGKLLDLVYPPSSVRPSNWEAAVRGMEKRAGVWGASLDEYFTDQFTRAGQVTDPGANAQILDSLTQQGWSSGKLRDDLQALAKSAAYPDKPADIDAAILASEQILKDLTDMGNAIDVESSGVPFVVAKEYFGIIKSVPVGVRQILDTLASGQGIRPWTKGQRCHDLASRLSDLEGAALGLDSLQGVEKQQARLAAYLESGRLNLDSKDWRDAVTRARKAVADLNIGTLDLATLDEALKKLGPDLDARFDVLRRAIETPPSPASIDGVIAMGWEFTRQVSSINFRLAEIGLPAFGSDASVVLRDLQNTLAKLAGYLYARVSIRGGLTTT